MFLSPQPCHVCRWGWGGVNIILETIDIWNHLRISITVHTAQHHPCICKYARTIPTLHSSLFRTRGSSTATCHCSLRFYLVTLFYFRIKIQRRPLPFPCLFPFQRQCSATFKVVQYHLFGLQLKAVFSNLVSLHFGRALSSQPTPFQVLSKLF